MKRPNFGLLFFAISSFLIGCGGQPSSPPTSTISGRVVFQDGLPARGAVVTGRDGSTTTSSNGAFVLTKQRAADLIIRAEYSENGVKYIGQNLARTYAGEQYPNVNIMLAPQDETATIYGVVEDRDGNPLEMARVFAYGAGALSSTSVLTDKKGEFTMNYLLSGVNYEVNAGGGGYRSDLEGVTLDSKEKRFIRFVLGNPGFPSLSPPSDVSAIAWTSPTTRDNSLATAIEAVKREFDPKRRAMPKSRLSPLGNPIEVQLDWTPSPFDDLLGYSIYRGKDGASPRGFDFFREPLAGTYIDGDTKLVAGADYTYQITSCSTRYPDDSESESDLSDAVTVRPLPDITLRSTSQGPLTFRWNPVVGAEGYVVFLFDQFPGYDVTSIWNNSGDRATGTEKRYTGTIPLQVGKTYYFLVMGLTNDNSSRTLSEVGAFVYGE